MNTKLTDLDTLWKKNGSTHGFWVMYNGDVFNMPRQVQGKIPPNNDYYDDGCYWLKDRLICRKDCLKKIWEQVKGPHE